MRYIIIITLVMVNILCAGGVGTTGANYLKIGLGAKAPALGENFTGLANDSSAVYWNPSGITQIKARQIDFMQMEWLAGISSKTFSGIYPLSETDYLGGYLFLLDTPADKETIYDTGALNEYKETGDKFKSSASVIDIAYSKILSEKISAGLGIKLISEDLAGTKSNGYALDAGMMYKELYPNLTLGLTVQNIAVKKLRADEDYPMTITLGSAYITNLFNRPLTLLADIKLPNDNEARYGIGAEYWLADIFALRGGYSSLYKFSFGAGLKLQNLTADYAYVPIADLGVTHRISVGYQFDTISSVDKKEKEKNEKKQIKDVDIQSLFNENKTEQENTEQKITTESVVEQMFVPTPAEVQEIVSTPEVKPILQTTENITQNVTENKVIMTEFEAL